jgi:ABC-2 type transport system permease protein
MISPQLRALVGKEFRQVLRSRGALLSATLLPLLLMVVIPLAEILGTRGSTTPLNLPANSSFPPGLEGLTSNPAQFFIQAILPLFITLGGLIVPSISATYTVVAERERRSLELLIALPVRLQDILLAKLLAMLALAIIVVVPLFAVDAVVLLVLGTVSPGYVGLLFLVLLAALTCSIGIALLLALLARDFRTANNLNGAMLAPLIVLTLAVLLGVPGPARLLVLIAVLAAAGTGAYIIGLRWLTFERYLA